MKPKAAFADNFKGHAGRCHRCGHDNIRAPKQLNERCEKCTAILFEVKATVTRLAKDLNADKSLRHVARLMIRRDWPRCEHCKKRFKALDKHVARKHAFPETSEVLPELF